MNIFENTKAFATPLLLQAFDIYGMELFDMDPQVLSVDLVKRFPKTTSTITNRMMAAIGLYNSNIFFQDPIVFGQTCRAFNRHKYLTASEPSMKDICWGVTEATMIVAPDKGDKLDTFSESIVKYIKHYAKYQGIITDIPSLSFINIEETNTSSAYDPVMDAGALENSVNMVTDIENYVQANTLECLTQISNLKIDMASEAKQQLSMILRGE